MNILAAALALAAGLGAADWQGQIHYQGQLTSPSGLAVPDGAYDITFRIYDDPSGTLAGSLVWAGETQSVNVLKGLFNVGLGEMTPLPQLSAAQLGGDCYLFVQVAGEAAEMLPRQKLLPAFFARSALDVRGHVPGPLADNLVVLDGSGKITAGLVGGGSIEIPVDLSGLGGNYAVRVDNQSLDAGSTGLIAGGEFVGLSAGARASSGGTAFWASSGETGLRVASSYRGVVVDPVAACCAGAALYYNAPYPAIASNGVNVTNECAGCHAGIFTNLTASGGSTGAALRVGGRIAAPDIVNPFIASAGVSSQVVTCPYCKAGDEVFLQVKGNTGNNTRYWVTSVSNGSFTVGYSSGGFGGAVSMVYMVVGDL